MVWNVTVHYQEPLDRMAKTIGIVNVEMHLATSCWSQVFSFKGTWLTVRRVEGHRNLKLNYCGLEI